MPDFKGYLSDLGGPSANMYAMRGKDEKICRRCKRPSCIHPKVCPNLNTDHRPLLDIYHSVDALPGIKKSFIGSGVRYDLLQYQSKDPAVNRSTAEYTRELIAHHVSGRLKVAPEHTSDQVLQIMRKPSFSQFYDFKKTFDKINKELNMRQQIIPYFISSHPGCTEEDMAELAVITKKLDFHLEQVQDFTPTPMTVATETWYTGYHPYTLQPVFSAKTPKEKLAQRMFFFWYKPEERRAIINELRKIGRADLIDKLYGKSQANDIAEQFMKEQGSGDDADNAEENKRQEDVDNSPVVKLVNNIIEGGVRQRASDIHIEPLESSVRVRYRIDGALKHVMTYDIGLLAGISARIKIIGGMDIAEKRKPQDGRITIMVDRREYDVRVSILPTVYGEKTVMRLTSKDGLTKPKSALGFGPKELKVFDGILSNPHGIILVTGPTGSGKSTTLASIINKANENLTDHIITLEDPIEYIHKHKKSVVNQREVGMDTLSYANALRAALREDPDIILVGEMRDLETISTAITAAETGHLVFSTLHTIGAASTIDRIIDVFPTHQQQQTRIQLAMILEGVISQALIPTADGHGRVAAFEVMLASPAIRSLIREQKNHQIQSTIQTSRAQGMITLDDYILDLYKSGTISRDMALVYAQDQVAMKKQM